MKDLYERNRGFEFAARSWLQAGQQNRQLRWTLFPAVLGFHAVAGSSQRCGTRNAGSENGRKSRAATQAKNERLLL